ncbi:MAG: GAF domain-containing protein [Chloroflexota bacterium]|nr:GAF domain-containing protein [Chloroflexota bacterium]
MTASDLVTAGALIVLATILVAAVLRALQDRTRASIDIALFFAVLDTLYARAALGFASVPIVGEISAALAIAVPYLMLRLLADVAPVHAAVRRAAEVVGVALVASAFVYPGTVGIPPLVAAARTAYFVAIFLYTAERFLRLEQRSTGVTRRRMRALSAGNVIFALVVLVAGTLTVMPGVGIASGFALGPGVLLASFFWSAGFTPPLALRRMWQEPELRTFFRRTASSLTVGEREAAREIVEAAVDATGVRVALGIWDEAAELMRFRDVSGSEYAFAPRGFLAWGAFAAGRSYYTERPARDDPANAALYRERGIGAVLSAPVIAGERKLGVLVVYASGPLLFPRGDLELVELLAEQAAIVLEAHALLARESASRAREEAARAKEDFMAAAAHDLRTPLTALLGRAQLLQRRLGERGLAERGLADRMSDDVMRLVVLSEQLLDSARVAEGRIEVRRERVDVVRLLRELRSSRPDWDRVRIDGDGETWAMLDRALMEQVIQNLVENALKYSPAGTAVAIGVAAEDPSRVHVTVRDEGIGIPPGEHDLVFERFRRGSNVGDGQILGKGLGLFICRGIVETHGGRIWAESQGRGTIVHVVLPVGTPPDVPDVVPTSAALSETRPR